MASYVVLTVIGEDRPGLVETLAQVVAGHGGNWLESRMSHLAGKFAGILRVSVPPQNVEALAAALGGLQGLRVVAEPSDAPPARFRPARLELTGADHAGIVRDVSATLARRGVNVEELETRCADAPMSGQALFQASARLRLPPDLSVEDLRRALEGVAQDLLVDIALETDRD
jgi:glycine cleavage system regulatory protein